MINRQSVTNGVTLAVSKSKLVYHSFVFVDNKLTQQSVTVSQFLSALCKLCYLSGEFCIFEDKSVRRMGHTTINHFDCNFDKSLLISKILSTATFIPPHVQQMQRDGRNFSDSTTQTQLRRQSIASKGPKTVLLGAHGERRTRDAEGVEFEAPRVEKPIMTNRR